MVVRHPGNRVHAGTGRMEGSIPSPGTQQHTERTEATMQMFIEHEETISREKWKADALDLIEQLAKTGREFTSDDLYAAGLGPAPHPNLVGPVFYRAMNLGYIIPTHRVRKSQRKARRRGWIAEYIGTAHMTHPTD